MSLSQLIDATPFFDDFSAEEKTKLVKSNGYFATHPPGTRIITAGETDTSFYILLEGVAEVNKDGIPITRIPAGSVFGEIAFLSKKQRTTDIFIEEEATLFQVDAKTFSKLNPALQIKIQKKLIDILVDRLEEMNDTLIVLAG